MPNLSASPLPAGTATVVIVLTATLALLALEYRGYGFLRWFGRNRGNAAIVSGVAVGLTAALGALSTATLRAPVAWTASAVEILSAVLLGIGLSYRREILALLSRPTRTSRRAELPSDSAPLRPIGTGHGHARLFARRTRRSGSPSPTDPTPSSVRTLRDLLYWRYAKILSGPAGTGKRPDAFAQDRFEKLRTGQIPWEGIQEYVREREDPNRCGLCGVDDALVTGRMVPVALGGLPEEENAVRLCGSCHSSKGDRGLYEHWRGQDGSTGARIDLPRPVEGKYLRLLQKLLGPGGRLAWKERDLRQQVCPSCRLRQTCRELGREGRLSTLCLDAVAGGTFGAPAPN